jgi:hypothetical protein
MAETSLDENFVRVLSVFKMLLPQFLFICRWIVQNYTIQRQIKRNGGRTIQVFILCDSKKIKKKKKRERRFYDIQRNEPAN